MVNKIRKIELAETIPVSAFAQDHVFSYLRYPACQLTLSFFLQLHHGNSPTIETKLGIRGPSEKEECRQSYMASLRG
jgi:hypothetical protein